jgi:hypothetical protein
MIDERELPRWWDRDLKLAYVRMITTAVRWIEAVALWRIRDRDDDERRTLH